MHEMRDVSGKEKKRNVRSTAAMGGNSLSMQSSQMGMSYE